MFQFDASLATNKASSMQTRTRAPRATSQASHALERALAACSAELLCGRAAQADLARHLKHFQRLSGLSRVALYRNQDDPEQGLCLNLAAQAQAKGLAALPADLGAAGRSYAGFGLGRLAQTFFKGELLAGGAGTFSEDEERFLFPHAKASVLLAPLRHDGAWTGFLRLDAASPQHAFTAEESALAKIFADILGTALGRRNTEESLRIGAQTLRGMIENMPVLVAAFDARGELCFWNRECERVSGFSAAEVLRNQQTLEALFPDEAFLDDLAGRGRDFRNRECPLICKDGARRTIAWSDISRAYPLPGWTTWRIGVDISERFQIEQAVLQAKQEWERTFDCVPDCILILDERLCARRLNMALATRLAAHPRELVGLPLPALLGAEGAGSPALQIARLSEQQDFATQELHIPAWGGHFLVAVSPFLDKHDQRTGTIVVAHDISRWKLLEQQLEQSRKLEALGTLAGGIAHDFNNILGVMLGYAEMMQASLGGGPQEHRLGEILRAGARARELIGQILAFSRRGEGRYTPLRLGPLVKEVLQHLLVTMPQGVQVRRKFATESDLVLADPSMLHQVVLNLCTNAVQAMRDSGGTLEVTLDEVYVAREQSPQLGVKPGTYVQLRVRDTGPGIPEHIARRIFDPFFTTKRPGEGTGMGLAVVHGIVHKLGGSISAENAQGGGACLRVLLPRARTAGADAACPDAAPPRGDAHVLLVDDEAALAQIMCETLAELGYRVTVATDPATALAHLAAAPQSFDLLLTDQIMPGMSGTELAERALGLRPGLPIALATGFSDDKASDDAKRLGIDVVLHKPVSRQELAQGLRRALAGKAAGECGEA